MFGSDCVAQYSQQRYSDWLQFSMQCFDKPHLAPQCQYGKIWQMSTQHSGEKTLSASVVNRTNVTDPTGFYLAHYMGSPQNHFWTDLQICKSAVCECRHQQIGNHIVNKCPLTKSEGRLQSLHDVEDDTLNLMQITVTTTLVKWNDAALVFSHYKQNVT